MARSGQAVLAAAVWLVLAAGGRAGPAKLPDGLTICNRYDPQIDSCLKEAVTAAFPIVADGLPTLGIGSIDPLEIKQLVIGQGSGPVKIDLLFNDLQLLGLREAWLESVRTNLQNFSIEGRVKFRGPIKLRGPYKVSGSVLVLPITGDGLTNITLNNLIADINIGGTPYIKGGLEYVKIKYFDLKLTVSHLQLYFSNLFNGDKALGETMNNFLNENWQEIYKELEPAFEQTLGATFLQITARFFQKVPFEQVFPK